MDVNRGPVDGSVEETVGESADAVEGGLDLTPRELAPKPARRVRPLPIVLGVGVLVAIGLVLFNGLENATTYFYNVDQALDQRSKLGDKRFRMQGNVIDGTVESNGDRTTFVLAFDGKRVAVTHTGDVPDLFQPAIPVVIEGAFVEGTTGDGKNADGLAQFHSDRIFVKHDSTYTEKNSDRLRNAKDDVQKEGGRPQAGDSDSSTP